MHYGPYDVALDANIPTITVLNKVYADKIGHATDLSVLDVKRIRLLYGCEKGNKYNHKYSFKCQQQQLERR